MGRRGSPTLTKERCMFSGEVRCLSKEILTFKDTMKNNSAINGADLKGALLEYANKKEMTVDMVLAKTMKLILSERSPLSQLLQYMVDFAGDQFISEEFYQRHQDLLLWLDACGCDNEEIKFRAFVHTHPDIFTCKEKECDGIIEGGCPKMICNKCGRQYYLSVDDITNTMCSRCVANKLGECKPGVSKNACTEKDRTRRRVIYAIDTREEK